MTIRDSKSETIYYQTSKQLTISLAKANELTLFKYRRRAFTNYARLLFT